jgi:hypothetical protein
MATRQSKSSPVHLADEPHLPVVQMTKTGKLYCTACRKRTYPKLIEIGYVVTHTIDLDALKEGHWEAYGWDGDSKQVSEGGDYLALECTNCFKTYQLPKEAEVEWK